MRYYVCCELDCGNKYLRKLMKKSRPTRIESGGLWLAMAEFI